MQVNRPKCGTFTDEVVEVRRGERGQWLVAIILHVRGGQVGVAPVLMPAGRDALFGAEIFATDKIMADTAHAMAAENQRGFVGGRQAEFSGFAQIAQVDKWAVEQVEIHIKPRAVLAAFRDCETGVFADGLRCLDKRVNLRAGVGVGHGGMLWRSQKRPVSQVALIRSTIR